jgi:hypothetical protein
MALGFQLSAFSWCGSQLLDYTAAQMPLELSVLRTNAKRREESRRWRKALVLVGGLDHHGAGDEVMERLLSCCESGDDEADHRGESRNVLGEVTSAGEGE